MICSSGPYESLLSLKALKSKLSKIVLYCWLFAHVNVSKQRRIIWKGCSAVNAELFLVGHLNIYLVFLKGGIFTVVVHVRVGNFLLCKSAVIWDKVIFWSSARQLPNSLKDSKWRCREEQLHGGNSGCVTLQVWQSVLETSWVVAFPPFGWELLSINLEIFTLRFCCFYSPGTLSLLIPSHKMSRDPFNKHTC